MQVIAFEEIGVLQRLKHLRGVCRLVDYGMTAEGAALVMPKYRCNLREWRDRYIALNSRQPTLLYLNIFAQLVHTVQVCFCIATLLLTDNSVYTCSWIYQCIIVTANM